MAVARSIGRMDAGPSLKPAAIGQLGRWKGTVATTMLAKGPGASTSP